ncbi:MAG: hypothetical protein PHG66_03070 [Candidatus Colwellbacteria bacterium]|nr:hypothetical protein [Candidatus Colwellbacteria bacterium]
MTEEFKKENDAVAESFIKRYFIDPWKSDDRKVWEHSRNFEVFFGTKCPFGCKYCYLNRKGDDLYPTDIQRDDVLIANMAKVLEWMKRENMAPKGFLFFSGEPFVQEACMKAIDMTLDAFAESEKKPEQITVPTGFGFMFYPEMVERVEKLMEKSRRVGIPIHLSASIDGKHCEPNRPFKDQTIKRDDEFYDKAFSFMAKWKIGAHPMIYSDLIENWKDNWKWFQEKFLKHGIPFYKIYLLEVRNAEWSPDQIGRFSEFIDFLIEWTYEKVFNKNADHTLDFIFNHGFNLLRNSFLEGDGRGMKCALQDYMFLRLGDLAWVPCHRTSYDQFIFGRFIEKNGKIDGFSSDNSDLIPAIYSMKGEDMPYCENCAIRDLCVQGCLGSQYEATGDLFSPIPTVCELEHVKVFTIIKTLKRLGLIDKATAYIPENRRKAFKRVSDMVLNTVN